MARKLAKLRRVGAPPAAKKQRFGAGAAAAASVVAVLLGAAWQAFAPTTPLGPTFPFSARDAFAEQRSIGFETPEQLRVMGEAMTAVVEAECAETPHRH